MSDPIKKPDLRGVTVATVLPFKDDLAIDWDGYARVLDYCACPDGVAAVFVNGTVSNFWRECWTMAGLKNDFPFAVFHDGDGEAHGQMRGVRAVHFLAEGELVERDDIFQGQFFPDDLIF